MAQIQALIPDANVVLAMAPEELAFPLLKTARSQLQRGIVHPNTVLAFDFGVMDAALISDLEIAMREGWQWLELNLLVVPATGINGTNGWRMLSRRGQRLTEQAQFDALRRAAAFPKELLHANIADRVWLALARNELDTAVFYAFKTVEESVRAAGTFAPLDIGVDLMRKAFDPERGPLTDLTQPKPEREALAHLFAGAIGSYKNPHSHRTVVISDHGEAQEMVLLASHLLRIVDSRRRP